MAGPLSFWNHEEEQTYKLSINICALQFSLSKELEIIGHRWDTQGRELQSQSKQHEITSPTQKSVTRSHTLYNFYEKHS